MLRVCLLLASVAAGCGARTPSPLPSAPPSAPPSVPATRAGCDGAHLLAVPEDLAARGPWAVGAATVQMAGTLVELWYPARPGSDAGQPPARYDLRAQMPPAEAAKIPDADNAYLACDCVRDLPLDDAHGPYPIVLFLHGAASFRAQSAFLASHWASRGFVVIAPDLPGIGLAAALGDETGMPFGTPREILDTVLHAPDTDDPLASFRGHLAPHVALVGHSLGAVLAASITDHPEVEVRIGMAGLSTFEAHASTLVLAGDHDGIAPGDAARDGFASAPPRSRLGIVRGAGHLAFSDLCLVGADQGGALAIAQRHGVAIPTLLVTLATDGCRPTDAPFTTTAPLIRATTAGVLEEQLQCDAAATPRLAALATTPGLEWVEHLR